MGVDPPTKPHGGGYGRLGTKSGASELFPQAGRLDPPSTRERGVGVLGIPSAPSRALVQVLARSVRDGDIGGVPRVGFVSGVDA